LGLVTAVLGLVIDVLVRFSLRLGAFLMIAGRFRSLDARYWDYFNSLAVVLLLLILKFKNTKLNSQTASRSDLNGLLGPIFTLKERTEPVMFTSLKLLILYDLYD